MVNKLFMIQAKWVWLVLVGLMCVFKVHTALADPWVRCADEGETCSIPVNTVEGGATVRYRWGDRAVYKWGVTDPSVACKFRTFFANPMAGKGKFCEYSFSASVAQRNELPQALHSVSVDVISGQTYRQFLDSSIYSGYGSGRNLSYTNEHNDIFTLSVADGILRLADQSGRVRWQHAENQPYDPRSFYTLQVVGNGIEMRKNGIMYWEKKFGSDLDGQYILHITERGTLALDDIVNGIRRWDSGWNVTSPGEVPIPESSGQPLMTQDHHRNWLKMGWHHLSHWTEEEAEVLHSIMLPLPLHDLHTYLQAAHEVGGLDSKDIIESFGRQIAHAALRSQAQRIIALEQMAASLKAAARKAFQGWHLVNALSEFSEGLRNDGGAGFVEALAPMIEEIFNRDVSSEEEGVRILKGVEFENSPVDGKKVLPDDCKGFCRYLSENKKARIDYAFEFAPTLFSFNDFKEIAGAGWLSQIQLRVFFTHPRVNSDGRYETQLRFRVLDVSGVFAEDKVLGGDILGVFGALSLHDFILPYTWSTENGEKFRHNAKFEGLKYLSLAGVIVEADLEISKALRQAGKKAEEAFSQGLPEDLSAGVADSVSSLSSNSTALSEATQEAGWIANFFSRFGNSVTAEIGFGGGMYVYYDIEDMAQVMFGTPDPNSGQVFTTMASVAAAEIFGAVGMFTIVTYEIISLSAEGEAKVGQYALAAVNIADMVGAFMADLIYKVFYGEFADNRQSITVGGVVFNWESVRAFPWDLRVSLNGPALGLPMTSTPLRTRFQFNYDFNDTAWDHTGNLGDDSEFYSVDKYGVYQLHTQHDDKCVSVQQRNADENGAELEQIGCSVNDFHQQWHFNKTLEEDVYEIKNMHNGFCMAADESIDNLLDGSRPVQKPCDEINKAFAHLWKIVQVTSNRILIKSEYDPNFCLDLQDGLDSENTPVQFWRCDINNPHQLFKPLHNLGIKSGEIHTIRTHADRCIDNEQGLDNPPLLHILNSKQQFCDGSPSQDWVFTAKGEGYFEIRMDGTDRCLVSVYNIGDLVDKTPLVSCEDTEKFEWLIEFIDDGSGNSVNIKSRAGGCLEVYSGYENGTAADFDTESFLYERECNTNQKSQGFHVIHNVFEIDGGVVADSFDKIPFKDAEQGPSTYDANSDKYGPHNAMNLNTAGNIAEYVSITDTSGGSESYWQGDLGAVYNLDRIKVFSVVDLNDTDFIDTELSNFSILVSSQKMVSKDLAGAKNEADFLPLDGDEDLIRVPNTIGDNWVNVHLPDGSQGRYIRIQRTEAGTPLALAEVEVYGIDDITKTIAPAKTTDATFRVTGDNTVEAAYINGMPMSLAQGSAVSHADVFEDVSVYVTLPNVMAFEISHVGGSGGLLAELETINRTFVSDSSCKIATTYQGPDWVHWRFNDASWLPADEIGPYGASPWGANISGIAQDSPAKWVWAADTSEGNKVFVRCKFLITKPSIVAPDPAPESGTTGARVALNYFSSLNASYMNGVPFTGEWDGISISGVGVAEDVPVYSSLPNVMAFHVDAFSQGGGLFAAEVTLGNLRFGTNSSCKVSAEFNEHWQDYHFDDSAWESAGEYDLAGEFLFEEGAQPVSTEAYWVWAAIQEAPRDGLYIRCQFYGPAPAPEGNMEQAQLAFTAFSPIDSAHMNGEPLTYVNGGNWSKASVLTDVSVYSSLPNVMAFKVDTRNEVARLAVDVTMGGLSFGSNSSCRVSNVLHDYWQEYHFDDSVWPAAKQHEQSLLEYVEGFPSPTAANWVGLPDQLSRNDSFYVRCRFGHSQ